MLAIVSGLVVSLDAFFIGLSLGLQKRCKIMHLVIINLFLLALCLIGFFVAGWLYDLITFEMDYIVGAAFIALGLWCILQYYMCKASNKPASGKTIVMVGLVMSVEAMMITMGITFVFLPASSLLIPISVAVAHFVYSVLSFYLARTRYIKRIPAVVSHYVSGISLIIYGLMAIFVEFAVH